MPDVVHSSLGAGELHEIKGAAAATAGQIPTANGSGGAPFADPVVNPSDGSAGEVPVADGAGDVTWSPRFYTLEGTIADISSASIVYVPIPFAGSVVKVVGVLHGGISTADATVTIKNSAGTSMGAITVAFSGSAAGDVDFNASLTNNTVTDNSFITVETDGASTGNEEWTFSVVVERSA